VLAFPVQQLRRTLAYAPVVTGVLGTVYVQGDKINLVADAPSQLSRGTGKAVRIGKDSLRRLEPVTVAKDCTFMRFSSFVTDTLHVFLADESGQGIVEYALIIAFVAIAAFAAITTIGTKNSNSLNNSARVMPG
jgi:Flp pilus assembly pilin Flp